MSMAFRHPVFGAITAYAAGAFIVLQAADIFLPALLFPDWVLRFLVILALLGLPVTAGVVWLRRIAAHPAGTSGKVRARYLRTRVLFSVVVFVALVGGGAAFAAVRPENIPVGERDWIVLADCLNETGETGLEQPLTDALLLAVRESRYVNVLPRNRIGEALERMQRSPRDPLTRETALELAQREGVAGVLTCRIGKAAGSYLFNAALVNPETSELAWSSTTTVKDRDNLVQSIASLTRELRASLGESRTALWREARRLAPVTTSSIEALKLYTSAQQAWNDGKYPEAAQLYEAAIRNDSLFARAHAAVGYYYHWMGDRQKGEDHLGHAEKLTSRVAERERLWLMAYIRGSRSDRDGSVSAYRAYLQAYPDDRDGWYNMGNALMFLDRCDEAIPAFRRSLDIDSLFVSGWVNTGTCYARQDKHREALPYLLRAKELKPALFNVGNLNHELGGTYLALGDVAQARALYERRLQENNNEQAGAHRSLGLLETHQGRYVAGMFQMREAIRLARAANTTLSEVRNRLYMVAFAARAGSMDVARAELARATQIADTFALAPGWLQLLGRQHARLQQVEQARRVLAKAKSSASAQNQDDVIALHLLEGEVLLAMGNAIGATEHFELANSLRKDGLTRDALAHAYAATGKVQEAAALYENSVNEPELLWEGQEAWFDAHLQLGRIAETRHDTTAALKHYSRLLELWRNADSDFPDLRYVRSRVRMLSPARDVANAPR